jgi:hypothetical protein
MDDRTYAVCFKGPNGLDEQDIGTTKRAAEKFARERAKEGCTDITVKLYGDGDLQHQWDLVDGKFKQYE